MNNAVCLDRYPAGLPLTADQITEFHAARILLLLHVCGVRNRIIGLTKLAKLDFFVRYPEFFHQAARHLEREADRPAVTTVESAMVRHHYGPWDPRYYQVLAFLEGRELLMVKREGKAFMFSLTEPGAALAKRLDSHTSYRDLRIHMKAVKKLLGSMGGNRLKKLVYEIFDREVGKLPLGQVIRP